MNAREFLPKKKLRAELERLLSQGTKAEHVPLRKSEPQKPQEKFQKSNYQQLPYKSYPEQIQSLISEKISLIKRAEVLFIELRDKPMSFSESTRAAKALTILSYRKKAKELQRKINYFDQNGILPPELELPEKLERDPVMIMKRITNLRTYISRARRDENKIALIPIYEKEIQELRERIGDESVYN